jgi:hypothetical protein
LTVNREGKQPFAAFIAAVLVAVLLAACGGSDSDSSGSTEAPTTSSATTTGTTASDGGGTQGSSQAQRDGQGQNGGQSQGGAKDGQSHGKQGGGGSSSQGGEAPLKVSGGGSEQFRSNGGDNSVQEFGDEGDESELQEVAEIVHGFYVARTEGKWDTACSYLAKSNIEQLEQLASQAPEYRNADCGTALQVFTRTLPAAIEREITTVDAGSFRHDGEQGFLIYYGAGHQTYAMPLKAEGGAWKVAALLGATLG